MTTHLAEFINTTLRSRINSEETEVKINYNASSNMTNIVVTEEMLQQLLAGVRALAVQPNVSNQSEGYPVVSGNFVHCKSRFSGANNESIDALIDAVTVYKHCANVSDANVLLGLSMMLDGAAATWWQGAKADITLWTYAIDSLRHAFGKSMPPHKIFRELFSREEANEEPTYIVVNEAHALLSKLPSTDDPIPEKSQIDMIYGLL